MHRMTRGRVRARVHTDRGSADSTLDAHQTANKQRQVSDGKGASKAHAQCRTSTDLSIARVLEQHIGVPVSVCASRMALHTSRALTTLRAFPGMASYSRYSFLNSAECDSARPGASFGQNSDHCWSASTRSMKRSFTHRPKKRSRARSSSIPWFFFSSSHGMMSACHGSR